jgi:hypothetical protein
MGQALEQVNRLPQLMEQALGQAALPLQLIGSQISAGRQ